MSEYWKSNPRKFCDFCKCWIADNKPSIEFHERGKRHKENVQTRLEEIGRKGKEDHENKLKENDYMKEMEEAALRAYKKDIEHNPDFTGARINELAEENNAKIVITSTSSPKEVKHKQKKEKKQTKWQEAKSPDGLMYYWNTETEESVWEVPKEGYISLGEQIKLQQPASTTTEPAKKRGKKIKKKSATAKIATVPLQQPLIFGPMPKVNPYGNWETTLKPIETVDLQLPSVQEQEYYAPELIIKKPVIKFTEKIVTLPKESSVGPVSFKKRKGNEEHKKNVRRRNDE